MTKKTQKENPPESFKNLKAVADYVIAQGWQVTERTVYNHATAGLLGKKKNGVYSLRQVQNYCRDYLTPQDAYQNQQSDELNKIKLKTEIAYKQEQAKLIKLKREIEEGKYVLLSDWALQLAGRAAVFETGFKGSIRSSAGDIIKLVDGDPMKTGELISFVYSMIDQELNNFTRSMDFNVIISTDLDIEDENDEE